MSKPVEFDEEQYAVFHAGVAEAFKKGVQSVPAQGPKNSFVNCNVTVNQSENSCKPDGDSPTQRGADVDEEQGSLLGALAQLNTPAEVLRMAVALSQKLQVDLSTKSPEGSIHRQSMTVFREGLKKACDALVLASKGDTSVERIYEASLNLVTLAFVAGHRSSVWEGAMVG